MKDKVKLLENSLDRVKFDESLRYHTFTKSSGKAQAFYIATNLKELVKALNQARQLEIPYFLIGSGTKISNSNISGLIIKNRSRVIKIAGIKGKVSSQGIGLDEAMVEIESGATFSELNLFLDQNGLEKFGYVDSQNATIGGSINLNPFFSQMIQKIKIWEDGEIEITGPEVLNLSKQVILSVIIKIKAKKYEKQSLPGS